MLTIEEIITQKPHLADPLRFYEKSVRFNDAVHGYVHPMQPVRNAYSPGSVEAIVHQFQNIFELPEGSLTPLQQALELGEIDFTRMPFLEVPAFSLPYPEDDLTMLLFLLARPYFRGLREQNPRDGVAWKDGVCPVCKARPVIVSMASGNQRQLLCSFCGTPGSADATGCAICFSSDPAKLHHYTFEEEHGFTVHACDACRSYVKAIDNALLGSATPDLADLMSLPLDIVVQGKGYKRLAPNAVGMVRMSSNG